MEGSFNDMLPVIEEYCQQTDQEDGLGDSIEPTDHGDVNSKNYALIESGKDGPIKRRRRHTGHFRSFREASLSISMLAKPSDDRKSHAILAGWNVSNLIQGVGILGVPYAVQQGGWASFAMIFFVSLIGCYTGKLLVECMYETSKKTNVRRRVRVSYPEVAEAVMGRKGYMLLNSIQLLEMFGAVVMYVVLLGTVWMNLLGSYVSLTKGQWSAINCFVALPSIFIRKMSIVSWFSMLSVFALISSIITLITFCFFNVSSWSINNIPAFDLQTFPVGFGIIVFSYCAHAVFPSIEGSMKKPEQFNPMMNVSFIIAAVFKAALGIFMVLTFGINTKECAPTNLAEFPIFGRPTNGFVAVNVLLAIPLTMFVVSFTVDDSLMNYFPIINKGSKYHWVWLLISRPFLLGFALFLGVAVPHFGLLMGIIGSFTGTCLSFIFPCYFHLKLRWESLSKFDVFVDISIIVFGAIAGGCGLVFSTKALVMTYM